MHKLWNINHYNTLGNESGLTNILLRVLMAVIPKRDSLKQYIGCRHQIMNLLPKLILSVGIHKISLANL